MRLYTFHREWMFYPLELRDDAEAIANAHHNPGTQQVRRWDGTGETVIYSDGKNGRPLIGIDA